MKNIKRTIEVKSDYDIVAKLNVMVRENKKLHYWSQVINNILTEYFNK